MIRRLLLSSIIILSGLSFAAPLSTAQSKINPIGLHRLHTFKAARSAMMKTLGAETPAAPTVRVIVNVNEGVDLSGFLQRHELEAIVEGGSRALVAMPIDAVESLSEEPEVRSISFPAKRYKKMVYARKAASVDEVHSGVDVNGVSTTFSGKGVLVGLMDGGLDPNHINFIDADGHTRVKHLWHFTGDDGKAFTEYTSDNIGSFTTDDSEETHATHVAGIMGGSYRGTATYIDVTDPANGTSTEKTGANPYYGVAYESDLAFSVGNLYDDNILEGVDKIISYGEANNQPVAINLSLGSNSGPHDGTDDFSQFLDKLGERAIICVAAGNEGESKISIQKDMTSSDKTIKTMLYYNNKIVNSNAGAIDIWSDTDKSFTVKIANVSSSGTLSNAVTVSTSANSQSITSCVKSGEVTASAGIDPNNGRYNAYLFFDYVKPKTGRFAIIVEGSAGQHIDMYFDGYSEFTDSYNNNATTLPGYTAGNSDGSISGMACGDKTISVGAYSTLAKYTDLDGYSNDTEQTIGNVATFSSYGKDFWGNDLPIVLAPGSALVSSLSSPYMRNYYDYEYILAKVTSGSSTNYWGSMEGTSMATPFVTGSIALWLQADPTLTVDDVKLVLANTCTYDSHTTAAPGKSGFGKINVAEGLKYIIEHRLAAIEGVDADPQNSLIVTPTAESIEVASGATDRIIVELYDLLGRRVASAKADDSRLTIATTGLAGGVYILRASTHAGKAVRKVVINHL